MRKFLVPIALAIALGGSSLAFAAPTKMVINTVKAYDATAHTLTLSNGVVYWLPNTFKDPGIKLGSRVKEIWEMKGAAPQADSVALG